MDEPFLLMFFHLHGESVPNADVKISIHTEVKQKFGIPPLAQPP